MLVLIIVLGALLGLLVLWFTVLRHERTVRKRAQRRTRRGTRVARPVGMALEGIGATADEPGVEVAEAAQPAEVADAENVEATEEGEPQADEPVDDTPQQEPPAAPAKGQRKLTDEILSRVESELARRETPRWKELAALVHHEFGVTVHPSSIQKAVKRRRLATQGQGAEPAPAAA